MIFNGADPTINLKQISRKNIKILTENLISTQLTLLYVLKYTFYFKRTKFVNISLSSQTAINSEYTENKK